MMKHEFITFFVILIVFYVGSLFITANIDVGYWIIALILAHFSSAIIGFILKKEFFAGAVGNLKYIEEEKNARLFYFVFSLLALLGILFLIIHFYF